MAFDKFKQLRDLRSKAKEMEDRLSDVVVTEEHKGWTFTMSGSMELLNVQVDADTLKPEEKGYVEDIVKKGVNKAMKAAQHAAAKKMMKEGGIEGLPGMGG